MKKMRRLRCLVSVSTPLIFQSKILCLSLLYLLTTLPLSIYVLLSRPPCLFTSRRPSPELFEYPRSYGAHKHALSTSRSSCAAPVRFAEYETALDEIRSWASNSNSSVLRYFPAGRAETFAGNFSAGERRSWFSLGGAEVPCGFLKELHVRDSDRSAMEECGGVVVASAVFGDHDKIRQPKGLGPKTLETVCFFMFIDDVTLKGLNRHNILARGEMQLGAWRVVTLDSRKLPYDDPAMNGVIPKHLLHRLFPNSKFGVWIDAKIQLTVDPLLLLHSLVVAKDADMAVSKHPFNVHTMEEAMATARWKKWGDVESLRVQMETYCENGLQPWSRSKLPYTTDVPDTAFIARRHGVASNLFSCLLFNELEAFNPRDQLAFAYVRDSMEPKVKINMFEVEVFEQIAIEYRHNLKREGDVDVSDTRQKKKKKKKSRRASSREIKGSSCESYLKVMWSEENTSE